MWNGCEIALFLFGILEFFLRASAGLSVPLSINYTRFMFNTLSIRFSLKPGNVDDRNRKVMSHLTKNLFGKLFANKGYVSKKLFEDLLEQGVEFITKQKKNAKNPGMLCFFDRLLLRKRALIESVNDF